MHENAQWQLSFKPVWFYVRQAGKKNSVSIFKIDIYFYQTTATTATVTTKNELFDE